MEINIKNENFIAIVRGNPFDMEYLKPPKEVNLIKHSCKFIHHHYEQRKEYIYHQDSKRRHFRKIFYKQEITQSEWDLVEEYKLLIDQNQIKLPSMWSDLKTLKYVYNEQFDKKNFITQIKKHIEWLKDEDLQNPSQEVLDLYLYLYENNQLTTDQFNFSADQRFLNIQKKGVMYTFGRDNCYRPIVYVNSSMIKADSSSKKDMNALNGALCRLLSIVQKNMFVEGKVENWIICINTDHCGLLQIDFKVKIDFKFEKYKIKYQKHISQIETEYNSFQSACLKIFFNLNFKVIGKIVECMIANYTCILHKLLILNPSWALRQCWKVISAFIPDDTLQKIEFLNEDQFHKIIELGIDPNQLEKKFGGNHENLTEFWIYPSYNLNRPPINSCTQQQQNNHLGIFASPSRVDSSHYHSMIDHLHFSLNQDSFKETNDKEITQDGMNYLNQNILDNKQFLDNEFANNQNGYKTPKKHLSQQQFENQLEQPHPSGAGCCSNLKMSCNIF